MINMTPGLEGTSKLQKQLIQTSVYFLYTILMPFPQSQVCHPREFQLS
jgi:hypothetical protein